MERQGGSGVGKHRRVFPRRHISLHQLLQVTNGFRGQESVRTSITDLDGDIFEHQNVSTPLYGVEYKTFFIVTGTPLDAAFHGVSPPSKGVAPLGNIGS
jgi:hypothetical protein